MNTPEEIMKFVSAEKNLIWKCLFWKRSYLNKSLEKLQKHEQNALIFLSVDKPIRLCEILQRNFYDLQHIINHPKYKQYHILKKKGGYREILAPNPVLKKIQRRLNYFLQAYYLWIKPSEIMGFIINPKYLKTKHSIIENAQMHVGKKYILNIDLKDFFKNISAKRVNALFSSNLFDFNEQMVTTLTLLTTYNVRLPTGAPTSPVISNFLCMQMDKDLTAFCIPNSIQYSRYADDLTFSSNQEITPNHMLDIINRIKKNNFEINERKLRLKRADQKQRVTGLIVNEKVNVDRKLIRKIRAIIHDITLNGLETATRRHFNIKEKVDLQDQFNFRNKIEGYIRFIGQVRGKNDPIYTKLLKSFNNSFWILHFP